jgi:phosphoribosyl-AMP cyclohydrolase
MGHRRTDTGDPAEWKIGARQSRGSRRCPASPPFCHHPIVETGSDKSALSAFHHPHCNLLLSVRWFSPSILIMNADFRFTEGGLIPAIVREANPPGRVLMMAWMNRDSIERTLATGLMHYWSRTRQKLWLKGETSGHTQRMIRWFTDCDRDVLLFEVEQVAGACHTGHFSCFFQELDWEANTKPVVEQKVFDPVEAYPK